ncbi:MAG TPA: hypothetical protein VF316_10840, partial [Polyangiaceae bacterium]
RRPRPRPTLATPFQPTPAAATLAAGGDMATKKTKTPRTTHPAPDVVVRVDAKLKKAYDALVAEIQRSSRTEMEDFDRRWEAAGAIVDHDPPLYVVGGHRDAAEFYRAVMKEEPRSARRYVRVARFASPKDEQAYGVAKVDAALGYIEAKLGKPLAHPPLPVALDRLRIPAASGTKSLGTATVAEISAATSKLTVASRKRPKTPARAAIEKALEGISSLADVKVSETHGAVSFGAVPLAALVRFASALAKVKLP